MLSRLVVVSMVLLLIVLDEIVCSEKILDIDSGKLSESEFEALLMKLKTAGGIPLEKVTEEFDEEEARKARERLAAEEEKLKATEAKAAEALTRWNALSEAEKAEVLRQAYQRAEEHKKAIERDIKLSTQLLHKEGAELDAKLDAKIKEEEEAKRKAEEDELAIERKEFEKKRDLHRRQQAETRTFKSAAMFWSIMFTVSALMSTIAFRR